MILLARLPQGFFTRAFVRAYAQEVGVNPDHLQQARLFAPPPCAPAAPVEAPVQMARRSARVQPTPAAHVVPADQVDTSEAIVDSSPLMSDAILPTPELAPPATPVEF